MNKQEAIEKLKALDRMFEETPTGAIKEAIEALEKQIHKKPDKSDITYCPHCNKVFITSKVMRNLPEPYKELATDNNVVTIGDKIRESNESLAEYISKFTILADRQRIIDYLNQPYME